MVIVCIECGAAIYDCVVIGMVFGGTELKAEHFVPIDPKDPAPKDGDELLCPRCGRPFAVPALSGRQRECVLKLEDGSWWPHPPV